MVYDDKNLIGLNIGSFVLRNEQWELDIPDAWAPMGPRGKIRDETGKFPTRELKGRPIFYADDQLTMGISVDIYKKMIKNYHFGLGDRRWPLVTHFAGCKPCGKFEDYSVERCLKPMDREFNFSENPLKVEDELVFIFVTFLCFSLFY
ncbi:hypothetical protein K2173_026231 [Erythroxylum novogranatense]|uniref:Uncharacterized protein n=1 Tax=Erythroxylum novogranatense TaxID=1862640 RepID=A0AAV8SBR7_9ROSI|nr:hypothetical protein K2173_026231 [Erythroxylum novogranatense]